MILFVDDDPNLLSALRRNLSTTYEMDTALSGPEALELIKHKGPYAVIVSDIQMPGMDGVAFLKEAHRISASSVKIALSGWADKDHVVDAVNHGHIYRFLTKPVSIAQINEVLENAIEVFLDGHRNERNPGITRETFIQLGGDLNWALENDQLFLMYQPQIELSTGRLKGFEALIRWNHPKHGLVPPTEFIPTAEINGMIVPITQWALQTACRQIAELRQQKITTKVAVNISAAHLHRLDLLTSVRNVLESEDIEPWQLELELTETGVVENLETLNEALTELTEQGVGFALDDFGSGYMNYSYLQNLPVQKLKIDRSFISKVPADQTCTAIVHSLITVGRSMGLTIVAEGLEEPEQAQHLRKLGCTLGQGYLFAKPLAFDGLAAWVQDFSQTSLAGNA